MNKNLILFLLSWLAAITAPAQRTDNPWQVDIAGGIQSFYAPVRHAEFSRPELLMQAGLGKPLGPKQQFLLTLQFTYGRHNYQGDAVGLQLTGSWTPVIGKRIELNLGTGMGYRAGLYANRSIHYDNGEWHPGAKAKMMWQLPVLFGIGYRSVNLGQYEIRPYLATQLQVLLGYSPDLSPLPISAALIGLRIQNH